MRHPIRSLLLVLAATALLAATAASPAASEPESGTTAPLPVEQPEPSRPEPGGDATASFRDIIAPFWPGRSCVFEARAHNPHKSGTDASGHSSWEDNSENSGDCPARAEVTVELQARMCLAEYPNICDWVNHGTKTMSRYSEKQVSVRYPCHTTTRTFWRTKTTVRVRISWWFDKTDTATNEKPLNCRPSGPPGRQLS